MWSPTAHKTVCSLSCLMRIAIEAPEELSESDLNEIIDVWQQKSRSIFLLDVFHLTFMTIVIDHNL